MNGTTHAYCHTVDLASVDADGHTAYIARTDEVFRANDYKISPIGWENVLIGHPAVVEAAVVPAPDPVRLAVTKECVVLAPGYPPTRETTLSILQSTREHLAPFERTRQREKSPPRTLEARSAASAIGRPFVSRRRSLPAATVALARDRPRPRPGSAHGTRHDG